MKFERMKRMLCLSWCLLLYVTMQAQTMDAKVVTYPQGLQTGMPHNDDYTVRVRVPDGERRDLFE